MKTSRLFLVVISSVLMAVVYSCGSSNEKSSGEAASADSALVTKEKTSHEQMLSEGWSYLGRVEVDMKENENYIHLCGLKYAIYFKDGHYVAMDDDDQNVRGYFTPPVYPVKKGTYRLYHCDDKYTYTGRFVENGDEYYFNF